MLDLLEGVVDVPAVLDRLVGHAHRTEDVVVETAFAQEKFVRLLKEQSRFGALDDAVVISRDEGHDLRDAQLRHLPRVGALPFCREIDRPDADYGPWPGHQPRHRLHGAQSARVGYGYGRPGEVADVDFPDRTLRTSSSYACQNWLGNQACRPV